MSCQQVPTTPAFNPYPRSVQVGEFEVAIGGGIWVAIGAERRRNRQFFSIAQLIVGDRGQQGIHAGIHAIGHLLDVYQPMVNKQVNAKAQFF